MDKFVKTNASNYSDLPMKKRFEVVQKQAEQLGSKITYKQAKAIYRDANVGTIYINDTYQVQHCVGNEVHDCIDSLKGQIDYLSIKRRDKKPCRNWSDFQQIKNMICKNGENRFAVEVYPPEKFLVNTSNQYHLWVFADGVDLGFGFKERYVNKTNGYQTVNVNGVQFTTGQGEIE